jgi:hypothetical protein
MRRLEVMTEIGSCTAIINKVQTTVDGGARITLDLNSNDKEIIKKLIDIKLENNQIIYVGFACETD